MSVFDVTTYLNGNTANYDELTAILNKMRTRVESSSASGAEADSTTLVDANSKTFTVAADDVILWTANFTYSVDDATCTGNFYLYADGVLIGVGYPLRSTGILASNGLTGQGSITVHVGDMTAGPREFKLRFRRSSGSGKVYFGNSYCWFEITKRGS